MKVSLIVTTYNNPTALEKVLESLRFQTRPPDEVIIADDGSGEETAQVIRVFSGLFSIPVYHVRQEHDGFRAAMIRNKALGKSTGDYLILLDGDCVVGRHFVSDHTLLKEDGFFIQGTRIHVSREAVFGFNVQETDALLRLLKMALKGRISNTHHLLRLPFLPALRNRQLRGIKSCNMSFSREDIFAVNGFNEDYVGWGNEDSDLGCRFFKYGLSKKVHPFMAICFHLWHPTHKTAGTRNEQLLESTIASAEYFCRNGIVKAA